MNIISFIKSLVNPFKVDIVKYPNIDLRRRKKLLEYHDINKIIDVGANSGQFAHQTFDLNFKGEIISFEPIKEVYEKLEKNAKKHVNWKVNNYALGSRTEEMEINVSENTFSSSLLKIMPNHLNSAPESKFIGTEKIKIETLDNIMYQLVDTGDNVLLKIDVQGYEKEVIKGALNSLDKIKGIQLEMSIDELYKGETLFKDMLIYIERLGFKLHSLENGFFNNKTGKLLQVDGIFFKENN